MYLEKIEGRLVLYLKDVLNLVRYTLFRFNFLSKSSL